ncbi:MAG: hypothetical protein ABWU19_04950 [Meiothermus cerbereus]
MKQAPRIPSPIPLMQVPDLRAHNTTYDWRMLFMLALGDEAVARWQLIMELGPKLAEQGTLWVNRRVSALPRRGSSPGCLPKGSLGHKNRLHHKRDVALGEDAGRTRKAAQTLAALGLSASAGCSRSTQPRRFAVNPMPLYRWPMGCIW